MDSKLQNISYTPKNTYNNIIKACEELENNDDRMSDLIILSSYYGFGKCVIMTEVIENKLNKKTIMYGLDELYSIQDDIKMCSNSYIRGDCIVSFVNNECNANDISYFDIYKTFNNKLLLKSNLIISNGISIIEWCDYIDKHKKNIKYLIIKNKTHLKKFINMFSNEYINSYDIIFVENNQYTGDDIKLPANVFNEYSNYSIKNKSIVNVIGMLTRDYLWDRVIIDNYSTGFLNNSFPYFNSLLKWVLKVPQIQPIDSLYEIYRLYDNICDDNILTYNKYTYCDLRYNIEFMKRYEIVTGDIKLDNVPGYYVFNYMKDDMKRYENLLLYHKEYIELSTHFGIYVKDHKQFINNINNNINNDNDNDNVNIDDDMKYELNNKIKLLKWIDNINVHKLKPSLKGLTMEELCKMPDDLCKYNDLTNQLGEILDECLEYIKPINKSLYRLLNRIGDIKEDNTCSICYEDYKEDDICIMTCCHIHICVVCFYKICNIKKKNITCAFCKTKSKIENNIHTTSNTLINVIKNIYDYKCIISNIYINKRDPFWFIYDLIYNNNNRGVLDMNYRFINILKKTRDHKSTPSHKNRKYIIFCNTNGDMKHMGDVLLDKSIPYIYHKFKSDKLYKILKTFDDSKEVNILLTVLTKKIYFHFKNVTDLVFNIKSTNIRDKNELIISSHIGHTISPDTKYDVRVLFNYQ